MNVTLKLFATLRNYNEKIISVEVHDSATVREIALKYNLPIDEIAIIMINGIGGSLDTNLKNNDTLSLFPLVGGG